ncbi:uncharacterized protein LOC126836984 [Adelges cooleyi]|uniref:uncharacterized protein LOC126836984 n=1 Tax=Adelges cooleyi TaxID=133065 RepID=UPI0021808AF7|nr:uncharacterized protein LOC126836984 [Adelges cooleyi]
MGSISCPSFRVEIWNSKRLISHPPAKIMRAAFRRGSYSNAKKVELCEYCEQPVVVIEQGTSIPEKDHSSISLVRRVLKHFKDHINHVPNHDGHLIHYEHKWVDWHNSREVYEPITLYSHGKPCGHHSGQHFSWDKDNEVWKVTQDCAAKKDVVSFINYTAKKKMQSENEEIKMSENKWIKVSENEEIKMNENKENNTQ